MNEAVKSHEECPDCGSPQGLATYDDGHTHCFSCQKTTWPRPPHRDTLIKSPLSDRGVDPKHAEAVGFVQYADETGKVIYHAYPTPNGAEVLRICDRKEFKFLKTKDFDQTQPSFYGLGAYEPPSEYTVAVVVEGGLDYVSARQMLAQGVKNPPHVYAPVNAGVPQRERKAFYEELKKYRKVVYAGEQDEAAHKGTLGLLKNMFPSTLYIAQLSHKDANDYLTAKEGADYKRVVQRAARHTPDFITTGEDGLLAALREETKNNPIPTKFPSLNELIGGIQPGFVTVITGPEGLGKTEFLRNLEHDVLSNSNDPICIAHFEETEARTLRGIASIELGVNCVDKENGPKIEDFFPAISKYSERIYLLDLDKIFDQLNVQVFGEQLHYMHNVLGVKHFFFDPINQLRPGADTDDTVTKFLDEITMLASRFVRSTGCSITWTAHTNDEGQTRDSRFIAKQAGVRLDIFRDHMSPVEKVRNTSHVTVSKNRPMSVTGKQSIIKFIPESFTMEDVPQDDF